MRVARGYVVALMVMLIATGTMMPAVASAEEVSGHSGVPLVTQAESDEDGSRGSNPTDGEPSLDSLSSAASVVVAGVSVVSLLSVPMTMRRLAKADDEEADGAGDGVRRDRRCHRDEALEEFCPMDEDS